MITAPTLVAGQHYAGIGSRSTPVEIDPCIARVATACARAGMILRSGGADRADELFEQYHVAGRGRCEIWLPWPGFNGHGSPLYEIDPEAFLIASYVHNAWERCSDAAKKLHARNVHQILGADLATPVDFVVCWTPGAKIVGGTATGIRIALEREIPVFNLADLPVRAMWLAVPVGDPTP